MKNEKIIDSWNRVTPSKVSRERMFNDILQRTKTAKPRKQWGIVISTAAAAVLALAVVWFGGITPWERGMPHDTPPPYHGNGYTGPAQTDRPTPSPRPVPTPMPPSPFPSLDPAPTERPPRIFIEGPYGPVPQLHISMDAGDGFGMPAHTVRDESMLISANPWHEIGHVPALPVFANPFFVGDSRLGVPTGGVPVEELIAIVEEAAAAMGLTITNIETEERHIFGNAYGWEYGDTAVVTNITVSTEEGVHIELWGQHCVLRFWFHCGDWSSRAGLELNTSARIAYEGTTLEEAYAAMEYLLNRFASVLNMAAPVIDIQAGYVFPEAGPAIMFRHTAFETGTDPVSRILAYQFRQASFFSPSHWEEPMLLNMDISLPTLSMRHPLGMYPIITADEARELLLQGFFVTAMPYDPLPEFAVVAHVELVYRMLWTDEVFMPYYLFYVEMPVEQSWRRADDEFRTFGEFLVPAVHRDFLGEMPLRAVGFQ